MNITKNGFLLSTDKAKLQVGGIHSFLASSYWATNIPKATVEKSIKHSLCFGIYKENQQVGFARIMSDYATFAYLADVFVLEAYRGHGLAKWLVQSIRQHPDLQGLRRWMLATHDAHALYAQYADFVPIENPEMWMEIKESYH
ncbi:GNAT family N-acetyltransferase [Microscilla marina]|uniref:Acetyltransferase, gnat family n=1 Tax=Microscilla marina ATCC 23134 TaxID=313606 RepID=A1ZCC7_MICM2|nr:GNAT family N-acetyltransferase [Microscilla marina]EAY31929.1 acetyltransferase, gnat family [Microscilla marina ATCC 23134]